MVIKQNFDPRISRVGSQSGRLRLKCDGTPAETIFLLSAKRTSPFKSAGASVQSTTGSRGVRISSSNAAYTMFRGSVKSTGYPFHSPVSPSLPLPCVTMCHHISTGLPALDHSVCIEVKDAGDLPLFSLTPSRREFNITDIIQGDPREPDIFKINSTQLFFK